MSIAGERSFRRRLMELGFVPGTEVSVVRRLDMGDVLEVQLRESRVSLRISEAGVLGLRACGSSAGASEACCDEPAPAGEPSA